MRGPEHEGNSMGGISEDTVLVDSGGLDRISTGIQSGQSPAALYTIYGAMPALSSARKAVQ
jgi:hypothetical protein